ncbi:MAG: HDOD domain-containing protein [Desulfobulbaceae bacterium]|nr:HDOD domain-containing protein [Desulfobulbaceae bacterium]
MDVSTSKEIFAKLNKTKKLPSPSGTTLTVIQLCHHEETSLKDIADVIQTDPAFTAEILKYANSFFLSTGIQVVSIQKAVIKLGLRTVVNLSLGLSLLANNKKGKCRSFDYENFWSISLLQAIAAKHLAKAGKEVDPEEIFICALLSHMGQLALASIFPQEYGDLLHEFGFKSCGDRELTLSYNAASDLPPNLLRKSLEKEQFEIDNSELTVELFLDWGLPAHYALATGFHDDLDSAELGLGKTQKIADLLNLSRKFAEICFHVPITRFQLSVVEKSSEKFDITAGDFGTVFDTVLSQWQEFGEIFEIHTRPCPLYSEIMSGADES